LRRPAYFARGLRTAVEAVRSFFYPQFENALLRRRPVANVDHPLDPSVPLDPSRVGKYSDFVRLWMGAFYKLDRLYGPRARTEIEEFIDAIRSLYAEAGSVYKVIHSTTTRPAKNYDLHFAIIHAFDPHLECVPSLHVLIVVSAWLLAAQAVERLGSDRAEGLDSVQIGQWIASLRAEALAITESVLFVKQHSINCIGASLFYLKRRFPLFGDEEAGTFVSELFAAGAIEGSKAEELRAAALELCASMERDFARSPDQGWQGPVLRYLESYLH
jgi:hypothetical protein